MTNLLDDLLAAALAAGAAILRIRAQGFAVHDKPDASPVTAADQAAEALILARLAALAPGVGAVVNVFAYSDDKDVPSLQVVAFDGEAIQLDPG